MAVLNGFYIILVELYRYTIHESCREMGVVYTLRDVSLKQAREYATGGRSVLREGRAPIDMQQKKA